MSQISELNEQELSRETRPNLEAYAVELGLTDASTYQNKPAVLDALKRVKAGEDAVAVNDELKVVDDSTPPVDPATVPPAPVVDDEEDDDEPVIDPATPETAPKKGKKHATHKNQGHPTAFDETGKPIYT